MNSQHNERIDEMMVSSRRKVEDYINDVTGTLTDALRALYKGKKVNCVCYECYRGDEDSYHFNSELLDIKAAKSYGASRTSFAIIVTFMSDMDKEGLERIPRKFFLETIESVEEFLSALEFLSVYFSSLSRFFVSKSSISSFSDFNETTKVSTASANLSTLLNMFMDWAMEVSDSAVVLNP